jgi:thioredoxin 1
MLRKNLAAICIALAFTACSGEKPYNESADAHTEVQQAITIAQAAHQPLMIVFGANWCPTCRALAEMLKNGKNAGKIASEFKIVKVDVGNFDHNLDVAQQYGNPVSGGIPGAAFILDGKLRYATKPGELSEAMDKGEDGLYTFMKQTTSAPAS